MNWNIIIPITIFITDILLAGFCYWLGRRTVQPIKETNDKILEEKRELEDNIFSLKNEEEERIERNNILDEQFNQIGKKLAEKKNEKVLLDYELQLKKQQKKEVQNFIDQSEQLAKDKAAAIYEKSLLIQKEKFEQQISRYKEIEDSLDHRIEKTKEVLESLKQTRAAAIRAALKEEEVKKNKNDYCLILPIEYGNDIKILRSVANQIAKPRAIGMCIWSNYYLPLAKEKIPKILGKSTICGIYKITNLKTKECYIGQSVDVKKRIYDHLKAACGVDTPKDNLLYQAMKKYGIENFSIELLQECTNQELNQKEKYFIELYQSHIYGYNKTSGNKTRVGIDK